MNAGFSNLDTLEQHLLAPALRATTTYDRQITDLGLGMAGLIEKYCNRKFLRVVGEQEIISADRVEFCLRRTPLESLALVELKLTEQDGWQQLDAPPWKILQTIDLKAGIVHFPEDDDLGEYYAQVRFTYTGGFFWEQAEPDDQGIYPTAFPAGATAIPNDLQLAWILQCKHVWQTIDPRGVKIVSDQKEGRAVPQQVFGDLDLIPQVKAALEKYIRWELI